MVYYRRLHLSSSCGTPSQTVHAERRIISSSTEVHRRYQNTMYVTWMYCWKNRLKITGTLMMIENCQMHGQVSQDSPYWMRSHLTDIHGPEGDWRGNKRPQDPTMYGQICGSICLMHQNAKRSKSRPSRNQSSIMPDNNVVSSSLNQMMMNQNIPWKNAPRKLEIPMPAAMPCKTPINSGGETYCGVGKRKTKHACIVEADKTTRIRLEGAPYRYHEDHIAAEGINSPSHYNLLHMWSPKNTSGSLSLYPSKNGRCSQIIKNSKIGVSRHLDSSTTTPMV